MNPKVSCLDISQELERKNEELEMMREDIEKIKQKVNIQENYIKKD